MPSRVAERELALNCRRYVASGMRRRDVGHELRSCKRSASLMAQLEPGANRGNVLAQPVVHVSSLDCSAAYCAWPWRPSRDVRRAAALRCACKRRSAPQYAAPEQSAGQAQSTRPKRRRIVRPAPAAARCAVRLPLAAGLASVLALRPRRRGTPHRQPPVIQTQIILAIVGAVVMLVVGTSLARAFGIVGAAGLVRYRCEDRRSEGRRRHAVDARDRAGVGRRHLDAGGVHDACSCWSCCGSIESFEKAPPVFHAYG